MLVKHKLTLKGRRLSGKVYLNGTVGPRHVRRLVLVQRKIGRRWVTIARVRTTRRSTFKVVRKAPAKRALFRARIAGRQGAPGEHQSHAPRLVQVFANQPEENSVDPLPVAQVRLPLHAFANEAGALRVLDRALVEPVDLELEPVEVEVEQEMALE